MSESDPKSDPNNASRSRLQALRAIPEAKRTDAEWDELNELEIAMALGKGQLNQNPTPRVNPPSSGGGQQRHGGGQRHGQPQQQRKFHRRPNRGGGGGGGGSGGGGGGGPR